MSTKNKSNLRKLAVLLLPLAILSITAETCNIPAFDDVNNYLIKQWADQRP